MIGSNAGALLVTQVDTFIASEDSQSITLAHPRRVASEARPRRRNARRLSLRHLWSVGASGRQQQPYWTIIWPDNALNLTTAETAYKASEFAAGRRHVVTAARRPERHAGFIYKTDRLTIREERSRAPAHVSSFMATGSPPGCRCLSVIVLRTK